MSKYIKLDDIKYRDVLYTFATNEELLVATEEDIESLPTIEVSEDCISREYMLEKAQEWKNMYPDSDTAREALTMLMNEIDNAPSVVPNRATGKWVEVVHRTEQYDREGVKSWAVIYQCPNCGFILNAIENHTAQYNYCPNCGARTESDTE